MEEEKPVLKNHPKLLGATINKLEEIKSSLLEIEAGDAYEYIEWMKTKVELRYKNVEQPFHIMNNLIYWAFLGVNIGSEQNRHRPILVVQSTKYSPVCSIIPLTEERLGDGQDYHVDLELLNSTALTEQLRVISKKRIHYPMRKQGLIVSITQGDWDKINEQLRKRYILKPLR